MCCLNVCSNRHSCECLIQDSLRSDFLWTFMWMMIIVISLHEKRKHNIQVSIPPPPLWCGDNITQGLQKIKTSWLVASQSRGTSRPSHYQRSYGVWISACVTWHNVYPVVQQLALLKWHFWHVWSTSKMTQTVLEWWCITGVKRDYYKCNTWSGKQHTHTQWPIQYFFRNSLQNNRIRMAKVNKQFLF